MTPCQASLLGQQLLSETRWYDASFALNEYNESYHHKGDMESGFAISVFKRTSLLGNRFYCRFFLYRWVRLLFSKADSRFRLLGRIHLRNFWGIGDALQDLAFLSWIHRNGENREVIYYMSPGSLKFIAGLGLEIPKEIILQTYTWSSIFAYDMWKNSLAFFALWHRKRIESGKKISYTEFYLEHYRRLKEQVFGCDADLESVEELYDSLLGWSNVTGNEKTVDWLVINTLPLSGQVQLEDVYQLSELSRLFRRRGISYEFACAYTPDGEGLRPRYTPRELLEKASQARNLIAVANGPYFMTCSFKYTYRIVLCATEVVDIPNGAICCKSFKEIKKLVSDYTGANENH